MPSQQPQHPAQHEKFINFPPAGTEMILDENMDATSNQNCDDEEFNSVNSEKSQISEVEERENGDGDSGGECKPDFDPVVIADPKKSKVSKIPVRQGRKTASPTVTHPMEDNESPSGGKRPEEIDLKGAETDGSGCTGESRAEKVDGIGSDSGSSFEAFEDIREIVNDLAASAAQLAEGGPSQMASSSPGASPPGEDPDVPILEAPEEFREKTESERRQSQAVPEGRDRADALTPETGDTSRRTRGNPAVPHAISPPAISPPATLPPVVPPVILPPAILPPVVSSLTILPPAVPPAILPPAVPPPPGPAAARDPRAPAATSTPSIEIGVARCARASGCSRASTAESRAALLQQRRPDRRPDDDSGRAADRNPENAPGFARPASWSFRDGRLVFDQSQTEIATALNEQVVATSIDESSPESESPLTSKELNKRIDDGTSRLKYLERKLKDAGITDLDPNQQLLDSNQNLLQKPLEEEEEEEDQDQEEEVVGEQITNFCEFDVRQLGTFSGYDSTFIQVYDELDDSSSSLSSQIDEESAVIISADGTTSSIMGVDGDRSKHNPDRDNLKSLLKRPGKKELKRSNRVVFNENKNEFFDADYIILIREECDYDDDDDDGVCTCNQHEMVRLTCCEPNCNCAVYEGYDQTPQSPKFAPPLEFVDAVTLSPPEGYKDMELGEQQLLALQQMARGRGQRTAVCRECSVAHDEDEYGDGSQSDNETGGEQNSDHEERDQEEKEKTDQSQQTTPTTPPNDSDNSPNSQRYILETITMTTVTEQRILREAEDERRAAAPPGGSPINGILKGGRLWKQQSLDANAIVNNAKAPPEPQQVTDNNSVTSDEEGGNRRSVRFTESEPDSGATRDGCGDGASDNPPDEDEKPEKTKQPDQETVSPESTEMMLTFKLGNHVLISNNSLKPNSAVRQLFPCTKPASGKDDESIQQYLVTAESLRAFEEAKRSKLPQIIQSGETDESIKRAIERNTLRRSLIRYEPRAKKTAQKTDNSLVERIKQLTCDVDDSADQIPPRSSPPGEEAHPPPAPNNNNKSFSPSSSSTTSSNSSSMSSTYKKITDLFGKRERVDQGNPNEQKVAPPLPDLGNGGGQHLHEGDGGGHCALGKVNSANESRKQFLATLAPLTACVSGVGAPDEYYYHMNNHVGERASVASSVGTEYSLEDIDEGLKNGEEESKRIAPDVLAGTPSASESGDELAMFVQQDAGRIERIKKKYQPDQQSSKEEDDEHDDYGFNRRPSVRGIKPKFGSTTEILQQIQNQLQPPQPTTRVAWPYYSESGLTTSSSSVDNKSRNINQNTPNYQYPNVPEELKTAGRNLPVQYRPTSLQDDNVYQNCTNQRCVREVYRTNVNQTYQTVMKVGGTGACTEYYQTLPPRGRGRPLSPPPLEMSKTYHQTMVYIPRNHIEGYQPQPQYYQSDYVTRVSNQNQINKRYVEPIYQQRILHLEDHHHYPPNMLPPKAVVRMSYPPPSHMMAVGRSESPLPGQFSTARATQTPGAAASTCYYPGGGTARFRAPPWQGEGGYVKALNGFVERGVPEGAAATAPQDSVPASSSSSAMTSPTSPQNPAASNGVVGGSTKPLFYAMNV